MKYIQRLIWFAFLVSILSTQVQASNEIIFPYPKGKIFVTNGYNGSSTHMGVSVFSLDMRTYESDAPCNSYGAPILATREGKVDLYKNAGKDRSYGTNVRIVHSDGTSSRYAHMIKDTLTVNINDEVQQGQILGLMGDTGNTSGMKCSAFDGENIGAHLHYEMRKADGSAHKPEPLIGEETYTGLSKAGNPYYSTSIMHDPSNDWDLYNGKVPYRLSYNPAQLESIHPLLVNAGSRTNFTISGTSLPDDVEVSIPGCNDIQWLSRTDSVQQFSCEMTEGLVGQEISNGNITSKTYGGIPFEFIIRVLSPEAPFPTPKVHQVADDGKRPGELKTFTIRGENLPGDLLFQFPECTDQDFIMRSPDEQQVQCRIPRRVDDSEGKRINDLHAYSFQLSDPRQDLQFEETYQEDYRIHINRVTPVGGAYGIPNTFTFVGDNVDLADAFFIERCGELREISRAQKRVKIQCTPLIRESFLIKFVPSLLSQRLHYFVVKDKPGGEKLIEGNILMQMTDKMYITGVAPTRPILLAQNEFEITGAHLPESLLVWIPNCDGLKVYPKDHISESIRFTCTPQLQNNTRGDLEALDQKMVRLMGPLAQMPDLSEFEDFFEKQKRIVEIKLPKNISDIDENERALLLSRKEIFPVSELYSKVMDQLEGYFPDDVGGDEQESTVIDASDEKMFPLSNLRAFYTPGSDISQLMIVDLTNLRMIYLDLLKKIDEFYKNINVENINVESVHFTNDKLILHLSKENEKNELEDVVVYDLVNHNQIFRQSFICPKRSRTIFNAISSSPNGNYTSFQIDVDESCESNSKFSPKKNENLAIFDHSKNELKSLSVSGGSEEFFGNAIFGSNSELYLTTYDFRSREYGKKVIKIKKLLLNDMSVLDIAVSQDTMLALLELGSSYDDSGFNNLQFSETLNQLFMIVYVKKNDLLLQGRENRVIMGYDLSNSRFSILSENVANKPFNVVQSSIYSYEEYGEDSSPSYRLVKKNLKENKVKTLVENIPADSIYIGVNEDETIAISGTIWDKRMVALNGVTGKKIPEIFSYFENDAFRFGNNYKESIYLQEMNYVITPPLEKLKITKVFKSKKCLGNENDTAPNYLHFTIDNQANHPSKEIRINFIQLAPSTPIYFSTDYNSQGLSNTTIDEIAAQSSKKHCFLAPYYLEDRPIRLIIKQASGQVLSEDQQMFYFEDVPEK